MVFCGKFVSANSYVANTFDMHIGADLNIFSQKFVKACVGATGPDWGFPEPK